MLYISLAAAFRGPISHITTNHNLPAASDLPVQLQTYRNEDNSDYKYCDINRFYSCETSGLVFWGGTSFWIHKFINLLLYKQGHEIWLPLVGKSTKIIVRSRSEQFPFPPRNGLQSEPAKNRGEKGAKVAIHSLDSSQDEERRSIPRLLWLFDGGSTIKNAFSCSNDDLALL